MGGGCHIIGAGWQGKIHLRYELEEAGLVVQKTATLTFWMIEPVWHGADDWEWVLEDTVACGLFRHIREDQWMRRDLKNAFRDVWRESLV